MHKLVYWDVSCVVSGREFYLGGVRAPTKAAALKAARKKWIVRDKNELRITWRGKRN